MSKIMSKICIHTTTTTTIPCLVVNYRDCNATDLEQSLLASFLSINTSMATGDRRIFSRVGQIRGLGTKVS